MDPNNDILTVKAVFGRQVRRFDIKKSLKFTDLFAVMCGLFDRGFDVVKYRDEDGDLVTLSSEEEYKEAIRKVVPKTRGVLKLILQSKDSASAHHSDTKVEKTIKKTQAETKSNKDDQKHNAKPTDAKHLQFSMKEKHGRNPVQYYTSLSAALKEVNEGAVSKVDDEPLTVFLPPKEISTGEYKPNYGLLNDTDTTGTKSPIQDWTMINENFAGRNMDSVSEAASKKKKGMKTDDTPHQKAKRKRSRRSRRRSSASSASSSSESCSSSGSSSGSSGSSSNSGSSSDSDSSESTGMSSEGQAHEMQPKERKRRQKTRQRKRHETKMIARQLTHYIAPEVCDEVAHCMHYFKKDLKHSMAKKIAVTIEETINRAFEHHVVSSNLQNEGQHGKEAEIGTDEPEKDEIHHEDITCDGCERDIYGVRYKCGNCPDFDLCGNCEQIEGIHNKTHVFLKIRYPAVNAGRKNGNGQMRCLLKDNIYAHAPDRRDIKLIENMATRKAEDGSTEKTTSNQSTTPETVTANDEDVSNALKGLEIAQSLQQMPSEEALPPKELVSNTEELKSAAAVVNEIFNLDSKTVVNEQNAVNAENENSAVPEEKQDEDDIVVVKHEHASEFVQPTKTPDLVDFDAASVCSNGSEEFIVVPIPSYFDINSPLDEKTIREHRHSCKGGHGHSTHCCQASANTTPAGTDEKSSSKLPVDLLASSLERNSRSQPDIAPVGKLIDADVCALNLPAPVIAEQPVVKSPDMTPLIPIINQPTATSVKPKVSDNAPQEMPVIYSRGAAPKQSKRLVQEPGPLLIRDIAAGKQANNSTTELKRETPEKAVKVEPVPKEMLNKGAARGAVEGGDEVVHDGSRNFNRPAEKFIKQQHDYNEQRKTQSTWSPEPGSPEHIPTVYEDGSMKQALAGYLTDIVDATASAVTAVGGAVSNAMKTNPNIPVVHYQEDQAKIIRTNGEVRDTHMPQENSAGLPNERIETRRPAMSAVDVLQDMGFFDRAKNEKLLKKYQGDVNQCVNELLSDNNWHSNRH